MGLLGALCPATTPSAKGNHGVDVCTTGGFLEGGERKVLPDNLWKHLGYLLGFIAMILPENAVWEVFWLSIYIYIDL